MLSRELGPLGDQRDRMSEAIAFRGYVEEMADSVAPPEPASFMQMFMTASSDRAERLREATEDNTNRDLQDSVAAFAERIRRRAEDIDARLSDAQFGRFEVVRAALNYNYAWKVYRLRRIRSAHADSLSDDEHAAFDDLTQVLSLFGPAREHFKTLYFRWELVEFSRGILYVGVPALAVSILGLLFIDPNSFPGSTAGVANIVIVIAGVTAIASTPFFLVVTHILRLGTIAQRTLAIGPFVLRDSPRMDELDFEENP